MLSAYCYFNLIIRWDQLVTLVRLRISSFNSLRNPKHGLLDGSLNDYAIVAGEGLGWAAPGYGYEAPLMAASPCAGPAPFLGAYDLAAIPSSYGGGFAITSVSPVPPHGISVMSDNAFEGILVVGGELPFLGTVGLEGASPTSGVGTISYGCGNGNVGMMSEEVLPMAGGLGWPTGMNYAPMMGNGLGYGASWAAPVAEYGLGCNATIAGYCVNAAWPTGIAPAEGFALAAPGYGYEAPLITGPPCAGPPSFLGAYDLAAIPSSYGGGFAITSMSPFPPHGVSVMSDNAIEGILVVGGELPFLGTVGLEGALPTAGVGTISYGCGNGNVGLMSEDILPMAGGWGANGMNYGPVMGNSFGYGTAWPGAVTDFGCGCSGMY
ncbi:uncharacterized protein [Battus philenor]|uniref:uncharacterized protein n=1 Tax=Battus philenor TaxID=42288 RepID=UPI0035D12513